MEEWRKFPVGKSVPSIIESGDTALRDGGLVAAGNWYAHAWRLGSAEASEKLRSLAPRLEELLDDSASGPAAGALLGGIHLMLNLSPGRAFSLLLRAAQADAPEAMHGLGFMLAEGVGVPADRAAANRWFRRGAELGDGFCAYSMALAARDGLGVPQDSAQFLKFLRMAAGCGIPEACALLADQHNAQDEEEDAFKWYLVAAQGGHVPAMWVVAARYEAGLGVAQDPVMAVRWLLEMMNRGNGDGFHEALRIARGMSADDIRRAGEMAGRTADAEAILSVVANP
ncbi:tetratricopeptide repeat protein [Streptomyces sp. KR55]|uniref:tetratricopeptide repeat protein n=1 Tax=Streptomyces sp. KR55 TaxID=3457425 RepID=UPI003FD66B99